MPGQALAPRWHTFSVVCTLLWAWRLVPGAPVILAGNRDELRTRPADPPQRLSSSPLIFGGRDRLAGGTWLAVDPVHGRVVAVTNRRHEGGMHRDPALRSRGELPLQLLAQLDDAAVRCHLEALDPQQYNPVNILYLSRGAAFWTALDPQYGRRFEVMGEGIHVLTLFNPDAVRSPKDQRLTAMVAAVVAKPLTATSVLGHFEAVLRDHGRSALDPEDAVCVHTEMYGTVSSSSVVVEADGNVTYRHAEGQACSTPYLHVAIGFPSDGEVATH